MISWLSTISASTNPFADSTWLWVRVVGFLGILAASAYFLTLFQKKRQFTSLKKKHGKIVIADTCPLGNRQYLVVAQYGKEKHLIAVNSNSISHLSKLDTTEISAEEKRNPSLDEDKH